MKTLLFTLGFLTLPLSGNVFAQEPDLWAETGLKLADFNDHEVPHCLDTELNVFACVEALNALAAVQTPPVRFATEAEKAVDPSLGEIAKSYVSGLNLYLLKHYKAKNMKEAITLRDTIKAAHSKGLMGLKSMFLFLNLEALFKEYTQKILNGPLASHEAALAGHVFNQFFGIVIDPHTHMLPMKEMEKEEEGNGEGAVGLGVTMSLKDGFPFVEQVVKNSGAFKAGVHFHDVIESIDGESMQNKSMDQVGKKLQGTPGTKMVLTIIRKEKKITIEAIRQRFEIPNVEAFVINDFETPYGYIRLGNFMDKNGCTKIKKEIQALQNQNVRGFVLDLRENGGGLLDQAQCIASLFTGKKPVVRVKPVDDSDSTTEQFINIAQGFLKTGGAKVEMQNNGLPVLEISGMHDATTDLPVVTLIDGNSASASEIVAGALQDHERSWIVGDRSYGKATVQGLLQYNNDHKNPEAMIALFRTFARFYQPTDRTNQIVGILPDFAVTSFPGATPEDEYTSREGDNYTALPPQSKSWEEPAERAAKILTINTCRSLEKVTAVYGKLMNESAFKPDYRMLMAQDILNCSQAAH